MLNDIINSCNYLLNNFPEAEYCRDYINSRLNSKSQELFKFGYFPSINNFKVLTDMVGEDILRKEKLFYSKVIEDSLCQRTINFGHFDNHPLIMPFHDTYGNVVAIVGRSLLNDNERKALKIDKYKNTTDFKKSQYLFGLYENKQSILDQNCAYIVEGQFDVIKALEKGYTNIVALGSANMSSYQFSVISRYTNNIFLLLDNDVAGEKGRKSIISKFGKLANIQNFFLPDCYKDIDEYLTKSDGDNHLDFLIKN